MAETTNAISLHVLGNEIIDSFNTLANIPLEKAPFATELTKKLLVQAQRFKLWAASLGLRQQGHASLDYRLRDAIVVRKYTAEVLNDLVDNLDNSKCLLFAFQNLSSLDKLKQFSSESGVHTSLTILKMSRVLCLQAPPSLTYLNTLPWWTVILAWNLQMELKEYCGHLPAAKSHFMRFHFGSRV
jgi:hypothetical protein